MTLQMMARLGLICLMLLIGLAACAPAAPTLEPTATLEPTLAPTRTQFPTDTPAPTATLTPDAAATGQPDPNSTPAAGGTAAPTTAPQTNLSAGGAAPDKYQYLGQDIADRTQFLPNRQVTITWTVKNIGTNGWTKEYTLRHFSGPKPPKDVYTFTKDVPAGDTINFVVTFTTPSEPGDYDLWFKLTNLAGQNFGDLDLVFTVSNNPVKATATTAP
jgi:hypothetical protein